MTIKKVLPSPNNPASLQLIRGSGVIIAEVTCGGIAKTNGELYLSEITEILTTMQNFNLIYDSL